MKSLPSRIFQIQGSSAVYFLIKDGVVVYVGQSVDVFARLAAHPRSKYDSIGLLPASEDRLLELEAYWIAALEPEYNQRHNDTIFALPQPRVLRREWPRVYWTFKRGQSMLCVDSRQMTAGHTSGSRELFKTPKEAINRAKQIAKTAFTQGNYFPAIG